MVSIILLTLAFPLAILGQTTTVTIPLSEQTPAVPAPQVISNGVPITLPKICAKNKEYSVCNTNAANVMAKCQSLFVGATDVSAGGKTSNLDFYACVCGGMRDSLACFDLW